MKLHRLLATGVSVLALAATWSARADTTESFLFTPGLTVPDGDPVGVADTHAISTSFNQITSVQVTLNIDGGFNGDLFAYLAHGSDMTVLLNRLGRTAANPYGYADSGLQVTLADNAPNGDIHLYQNVTNPGGGPLTGLWQPDARAADPAQVLDTSARSLFFSGFDGQNPNGDWTLFISDLSPVGISSLRSWELQVTGVPEPGDVAYLAVIAGGVLLVGWMRWRRQRPFGR